MNRNRLLASWRLRRPLGLLSGLLMGLLCGAFCAAAAQDARPLNPKLLAAQWPSSWIAPDVPGTFLGPFYARKTIQIGSVPTHYWVHVSADNRFILHVNGQYAAEGPARGDLFHWRFETVDLAPLLHTGSNVIAAIVWDYGEEAPVAQMSHRAGFLMQGDTDAEAAVNTGKDWGVATDVGRGAIGHGGLHDYYAAGPAERIDGSTLDWNWDAATDDRPWWPPVLVGHASTRGAQDADNPWELVQDELPPMEHRLTDAGTVVRADGMNLATAQQFPAAPLDIPAHAHVTLLLDHRVLQTAYPELTVSGGEDAHITMTYAEALYDFKGNKGNRNDVGVKEIRGITDRFDLAGGDHRAYAPLWWRTWRYLQIDVTTGDDTTRLEGLRAWFTAYPFAEKAKIDADIPQLDELWQTGWRTARLCAHETYMDAPYWEQMQYVGDTRIQALISYAVTGDSRLAKQAIENIDDSRVPEGITQSRYPSSLPQFIPPFSLLWVGMLHDYWMYVDDEPLVRTTLPHTRTVLDWFAARQRPDGLLGRIEWWPFGDWTADYPGGVPPQEADGGSSFLTLQFIEALGYAAEMETKFGSAERATQYRAMITRAKAALVRENWDPRFGLFADTPQKKTFSQEANILAAWLDVAPPPAQPTILRKVLASLPDQESTVDGHPVPPMSTPTYYFRFYLARALDHAGMADDYVAQLGPWYDMLRLGLSTWAENPEPTRSDCHAWSASPNYDLLTLVAGIAPEAPGFRRVRIAPHLRGLHHLEASMPHGAGAIQVRYTPTATGWTATVTLPAGLPGDLVWKGHSYPLHAGEQTVALR